MNKNIFSSDELSDLILERLEPMVDPALLCIDGYYGAGKTTLANFLIRKANAWNKNVLLISTDEFMRYSRSDRSLFWDRYSDHPNWYDISKLTDCLDYLFSHRDMSIQVTNLYDHKTGELCNTRNFSLRGNNLIILEGMYACHKLIQSFRSFGILLTGNHSVLLSRTIHRDRYERDLDEDFTRSRYWIINGPPYQQYIESIKGEVDLSIDVSMDNQYGINVDTR